MSLTSTHFIAEPIEVQFDAAPLFEKQPGCPACFVWREQTYTIVELLEEWRDYRRKGRMASNMRPAHAEAAAARGSWGVGRIYFRVRVATDQIFELYYDRAPSSSKDGKGTWQLYRELIELDHA